MTTLRRTLPLILILAACTPRGGVNTASSGDGFDVIIENGRVIDGTGAAWYYGDVALRGDRIAAIGPRGTFRSARATTRVDATGQVVAPGFIDIQAHSIGHYMTGDGKAISMITQGITTAIHGEGSSLGPMNDKLLASETDTASRRVLAVQRALTDFGYGQVKPTGVMSPETKSAIERFERERKLPVTGQISDRLARELAAITGRPIE